MFFSSCFRYLRNFRKNGGKEMKEITINGEVYIKKQSSDELEYKIVRTYSAGVFAGYLKKMDGKEVTLINARRIWRWEGAASLSQLAQSGTSKPENCKVPEAVDEVLLTEAIEILNVTKTAKEIIEGIKVWKS